MKPAHYGLLVFACFAGVEARLEAKVLAAGQVFNAKPGQMVGGWAYRAGTLIPKRKTERSVTTETLECCAAVFERGKTYLVARTVPAALDKAGGVVSQRIVEVLMVEKSNGEISPGGCSLLWITPAWTLLNERTRAARSFVVTPDDGIRQISWIDDRGSCSGGD